MESTKQGHSNKILSSQNVRNIGGAEIDELACSKVEWKSVVRLMGLGWDCTRLHETTRRKYMLGWKISVVVREQLRTGWDRTHVVPAQGNDRLIHHIFQTRNVRPQVSLKHVQQFQEHRCTWEEFASYLGRHWGFKANLNAAAYSSWLGLRT